MPAVQLTAVGLCARAFNQTVPAAPAIGLSAELLAALGVYYQGVVANRGWLLPGVVTTRGGYYQGVVANREVTRLGTTNRLLNTN